MSTTTTSNRSLGKRNSTLKLQQRVPTISTTRPIILDDHLANVPPESNSYLRQKEKVQYDHAKQLSTQMQSLLPTLDDPQFHTKLVQHPEFHAPEKPQEDILSVESESNRLCSAGDDDDRFVPHQLFVRHFLSPQSPYNSLLLYHSATANRFCAAIGVAEEWRSQQNKIVIVTESARLFRNELFHPTMLELLGDRVVAKRGCATEGLLRDVNPLNRSISLEEVSQQIQQLIETSYSFTSPAEFSWGSKEDAVLVVLDQEIPPPPPPPFGNRQQKLLLLSAFPMLKTPKEIIPLVNLMNAMDGRGLIEANEVFDPKTLKFVEAHKENGNYVQEAGYDLLKRKLTGYVSYLRSESPYTHALRLYPDVFAPDRVFRESTSLVQSMTNLLTSPFAQGKPRPIEYPEQQIHGEPFTETQPRLRHLPLYLTLLGEEQEKFYHEIAKSVDQGASLHPMLEALIMTYPSPPMGTTLMGKFDDFVVEQESQGLARFTYRTEDRIFSPDRLPKFSGILSAICHLIQQTVDGTRILIASKEEGLVPFAMALEEYGIARRLPEKQAMLINAATTTNKTYGFINSGGDDADLAADILLLNTQEDVCINRTDRGPGGSPFFRNIRQVHFLDPPLYFNRLEEIIACSIFPRSHCGLPFSQRNVEIYMHASVAAGSKETANVYVYRKLTDTARAIGKVTRLMKEVAVDCLFQPRDFSMERMGTLDANRNLQIQSASVPQLTLEVGGADRPFSAVCDYMQSCTLPAWASAPTRPTSQAYMLEENVPWPPITQRIRQVFQEKAMYPRQELLALLQRPRLFPLDQIVRELGRLVTTKNAVLFDKYGRRGYLVNHANVYKFQPVEITDTHSGVFERTVPVESKPVIVGGGGSKRGVVERVDDVSICVDVATGDSNVKLADPWYKTVKEWFNELQLVHHITASQVRQIVVDHALEVMPEKEQIELLARMYSKIHTYTASPVDRLIRASLDRRFDNDDDDKDEVCRLGPRSFYQQANHKWVKEEEEQDDRVGKGKLDQDGHLVLHLDRSKRLAKDMKKQDLLVLLEQASVLSRSHLRKRKVTHSQLIVLVEVLLRHFQQKESKKEWFS
jgi:hypothetical protein